MAEGIKREAEYGIKVRCPKCFEYGSDGKVKKQCSICHGEGTIVFEVVETIKK